MSRKTPSAKSRQSPPAGRSETTGALVRILGSTPGISAALVLIVLVAYAPVCRFDFINHDDPEYVTENKEVTAGLSWHGVAGAFSQFVAANWHPVTMLSHMATCQFFGVRPGWHHAVNVAFHAANAALLFLVLLP